MTALKRHDSAHDELHARIEELEDALRRKDEALQWYENKLKEVLAIEYKAGSHGLERESRHQLILRIKNLHREYAAMHAEVRRLQRFSLDTMPKLFSWPVKAIIRMCKGGPIDLVRVIKARFRKPKPRRVVEEFPSIALVAVSYNSTRFLEGFFRAVGKLHYPREKLTVHILDNASSDNSFDVAKKLAETLPFKCLVSRSDHNLGFAGGNNHVMRRVLTEGDAQFIFLLNIDTEIEPMCLRRVVDLMRDDSSVAMVEAKQVPREHPKHYHLHSLETGWCSGGGVLIDCDALREVGLFDEKFFLYCEDVDLSWRMWLAGWKCRINPKAEYVHFTEDLTPGKDLSNQRYYSLRNGLYLHFKYNSYAGYREHLRLFWGVRNQQPDEMSKQVFDRAYRDFVAAKSKLFVDRMRYLLQPRGEWLVFNGFDFERRRPFTDTADGRIILQHD